MMNILLKPESYQVILSELQVPVPNVAYFDVMSRSSNEKHASETIMPSVSDCRNPKGLRKRVKPLVI